MAIKTATLVFEEEALFGNLAEIAPNTILMAVVDGAGEKQVFRLNTDGIKESETVLCNTETGLCLRLIDGQWVWVPC